MRVLLGVPTHHYKQGYPTFLSASDFPTGFGYLASSLLQAGHDVVGFNPNNITGYASAQDMLRTELSKVIKGTKPDVVATGGLCVDYAFLKDFIQTVRGVSLNIPIILGGRIISADRKVFDILKPDVAILDEAEEPMVDLVTMMAKGFSDYKNIHNIAYWDGGNPVFTETDYNYSDIDSLPFPEYDVFNMKDMVDNFSMATRILYRYTRPYPRPFGIVASRQCPFNCSFCQHSGGPKYRARSVDNILEEIKQSYEKYEFNVLLMLDELFAVNKKRMVKFCTKLIEAKEKNKWDFDWTFQTHAAAALDKETLQLAKESGCYLFSYGLESASPTVLKSMNKRIKVQQVEEAIKLANETGLAFSANLIFGDIAETEETMAESLAFWLKYGRENLIFLAHLMPYPGSKIFDYCMEKGIIPDRKVYYEKIDEGGVNMTQMSDRKYSTWLTLINGLERSWATVKTSPSIRIELENLNGDFLSNYVGERMYRIWITCPHCQQETLYRQPIKTIEKGYMFGPSCIHCGKRVRVDIYGNEAIRTVA